VLVAAVVVGCGFAGCIVTGGGVVVAGAVALPSSRPLPQAVNKARRIKAGKHLYWFIQFLFQYKVGKTTGSSYPTILLL
jgi:hypothetical protein